MGGNFPRSLLNVHYKHFRSRATDRGTPESFTKDASDSKGSFVPIGAREFVVEGPEECKRRDVGVRVYSAFRVSTLGL